MRQRSSYPKPFKAQVVQECLQPGATVSSVAISHGINANVIRKWLPLYRDQPAATSLPAFVPLKAAPKRPAEASVIIELPVAGQVITVKLKNSMTTIDEISKRTQRKPKFTSTRPVTKKRPQPTPRISGSILTPLPKHISGR